MNKFKLFVNDNLVIPVISKFPGGEIKVTIPQIQLCHNQHVRIEAMLISSDDIMTLVMLKDALTRGLCRHVRLTMPYIPYARQDRVCNPGEAFSLHAFSKLINSLNFDSVVVYDAHSSVSTLMLDRCVNVPSEDLMINNPVYKWLTDNDYADIPVYLVSPDAGAAEKSLAIKSKFPQIKDIIYAQKVRDPLTGEILKTVVNDVPKDISRAKLLICDDIGDGFGSFLPLAQQLREHKPLEINIYVTHGIFSRGETILHPLFDNVWCTVDFRKYQ